MSSFERRISDNINRSIATPIWQNEKKTYKKISDELGKYGSAGFEGVTKGSECLKSGMARIGKFGNEIVYTISADETGHVILAVVSPEKVEFPQYGDKKIIGSDKKVEGIETIGKLPLSEVKDTVIETIEKTVREHPIMGKYAHMILGDFNNILSLDSEREIKPISEAAMINATLKEDTQRKDIQIEILQRMLSKTLEFAKNVRDSVVGKIFFKNKIEQLDLPVGELTEGDKDER